MISLLGRVVASCRDIAFAALSEIVHREALTAIHACRWMVRDMSVRIRRNTYHTKAGGCRCHSKYMHSEESGTTQLRLYLCTLSELSEDILVLAV